MALGVRSEAGGGFDGAGSANGEEDGAAVDGGKDAIEVERNFAEPADVWTDLGATGAARKFRGRYVEGSVVEGSA